jgi:hypothetical protein
MKVVMISSWEIWNRAYVDFGCLPSIINMELDESVTEVPVPYTKYIEYQQL